VAVPRSDPKKKGKEKGIASEGEGEGEGVSWFKIVTTAKCE
jgi:hypothetical protein